MNKNIWMLNTIKDMREFAKLNNLPTLEESLRAAEDSARMDLGLNNETNISNGDQQRGNMSDHLADR